MIWMDVQPIDMPNTGRVVAVLGRTVLTQPTQATVASSDQDPATQRRLGSHQLGPVPGLVRSDAFDEERLRETTTIRRDPRLEMQLVQSRAIGRTGGFNQHDAVCQPGALTEGGRTPCLTLRSPGRGVASQEILHYTDVSRSARTPRPRAQQLLIARLMDSDVKQPVYDTIGGGYRAVRNPDPRLASKIADALGDCQTVVNVGAGAGSYEPVDRWVLAVEPSGVMIAQRPPDAAPVLQASAEDLPLADRTVDGAMAILTMHHWPDLEAGLDELLRVVRRRIVIVTMDVPVLARLWIIDDYLPEFLGQHTARFPSIERLCELLPNSTAEVLAVPRDCTDGFLSALWARPHALLDPATRAATSPWYDLPAATVKAALTRLQRDLQDGTWQQRHGDLLKRSELDVGLRLITSRIAA